MSTPPSSAPAPQKRNASLWAWVIGLVAVGFLILGAGALFMTRFLVNRIEVNRAATSVEINTPVGTLKATKDETADPGLPIYPGAKLSQPGGTVEIAPPEEESISITSAHYTTIDSVEKVDAWYREQLDTDFKREGPGVMVRKKDISGVVLKSSDIAYIAEKDDLVRVVSLQKKFNGVEIVLLRAGKQETE